MLDEISQRVKRAMDERVFPGCVIGVIDGRGNRVVWPFGWTTYEATEEVTDTTVYDLASITKSIPTASLALLFASEGALKFGDPVSRYLPELQNHRGATIEDLMRYRVQGVRLSTLGDTSADEIHARILETGFKAPPGESVYTNLPAYLLGLVVERVGAAPLPQLAQDYLFGPLYMNHTGYFPALEACAPSEQNARGDVRGLPHDESAYVFAKAGRGAGHAGLFSRAGDLLDFFETLLNNDLPAISKGAAEGLGWQVNDARLMGKRASELAFGKTGFTGTSVVCDLKRGIAFVILSNRTHPRRPDDQAAIHQFRADIADIILR